MNGLARKIARRLTRALEIPDHKRSDEAIDDVVLRVIQRTRYIDAAFVAIQSLHDFDVISRAEKAYLLAYILDYVLWNRIGHHDEGITKLIRESPDHLELIQAAMRHEEGIFCYEFYASRGEEELAKLMRDDIDAYYALDEEGRQSIHEAKENYGPSEDDEEAEAKSEDSSVVMEKLIGQVAKLEEGGREWHPAYEQFVDALDTVTPAAAARAIQEAREIGAISFAQSADILMDYVVSSEALSMAQADRTYQRLERRRDELAEQLKVDYSKKEEEQPFEYRLVEQAIERRYNAFAATLLRQYGEHRIANLLIDDPAELQRIIDES